MSIQPRKRFAQHWLQSQQVLQSIIKAAQLETGDRLLEIGPGTGNLTRQLLSQAESVLAVEIDRDLCQKLTKKLGKTKNFLLLQGDVLTLDMSALLVPFPAFQNPNKVVANIPYNITGPIIEKLLGKISRPQTQPYDLIVLLLQKEVAQRLGAKAGTKEFGALSVRVQYLADCELISIVPRSAFYPPPKVESAVVRLRPRSWTPAAVNPRHMEMLVKVGFAAKRKMLRNNLKSVVESDRLLSLLEQLQISPQARAEDLNVSQWVELSNRLQRL